MMHNRKRLASTVVSILVVGLLLAGCRFGKGSLNPANSETASDLPESLAAEASTTEDEILQVDLYIGTVYSGFRTYPAQINGEITAEALIDAISQLTGWDLSLADKVTSGKGGMSVSFSPSCAIFTGPPEPQKEEFFVYDNVSLAQMILDSIQETLRRYFVREPGDPSSFGVWFSVEDQPIEIEGMIIPIDKPWNNQFPAE